MTTQQFQTAARRRGGGILKFTIQHYEIDPETGEGTDIDVELRVDPLLDVVRLGAAFGHFSAVLTTLRDEDVSVEDKLAGLDSQVPEARRQLRQCLVPTDREKWDRVAAGVDIRTIGQLVRWLTQELSPMDPTQQASSSDGSTPTSEPSTAGAQPAAWTPPASPTPEP